MNSTFFSPYSLDEDLIERKLKSLLPVIEDGEIYCEWTESEYFGWDDRCLKNSSFHTGGGFGLRGVVGELTGYAYGTECTAAALDRAIESVSAVRHANESHVNAIQPMQLPVAHPTSLYMAHNPLAEHDFATKLTLLQQVDDYLRSADARVKQVSVSLSGGWKKIWVYRHDGVVVQDTRPLVQFVMRVMVEENGVMETGSASIGGRESYTRFITSDNWKQMADKALKQAITKLGSIPAPAGEMAVVLGAGIPGVLLHEAVGHGLEGDFNRKKTSAFSEKMGKRVASPGVTVVDDGTLPHLRGSLTVDDEGTPTQCTTLIEDGILVGYLQDRLNARLMGHKPTGNGRRESFASQPMPRMTNTFMRAGDAQLDDLVRSVKKGIYAVDFGGGQVDITSGKFVFAASEAYLIEDGVVGKPLKDAMLIGNGPDVMTKIGGIGNDLALDPGTGSCGKNGQTVPVGVGQPSLLVTQMTVGGRT